jgi:hypothetical protein
VQFYIDDGSMRKQMASLKTSIPAAAKAAGEASTKKLAERLAARIRELIPNKDGWYDIYRSGVQLVEISPGAYEISTNFTQLGFDKIEAATSLLWFSGGDDVSQLLGADNPWTVDTIPSIVGGFSSDIIIRPGSESEVDFHRRKQRANAASITLMIERLGRQVSANALPAVNGRVMADVPFLARRLEYGLGGFPRTQIWGRLPTEASNIGDDKDVHSAGDDAFVDELNRRME